MELHHLLEQMNPIYNLHFHIYFYGCPYGFFGVALLIVYTLVAHGLVATVLRFELPASERLDVTWENTRAYCKFNATRCNVEAISYTLFCK